MLCPCCHRPLEGAVDPEGIPMSATRRTIVRALPGTIESIASAVYGIRGTGAADQYQSLRAIITNIRKLLEPHGWTIDDRRSGRGNVKVYRLVRLP